jgi:preprotein translocase subunit SecG
LNSKNQPSEAELIPFERDKKVQILITIVHVIVCIVLILVVLLQAGKGANMGAVFGGSSQTIFGSSGPGTFLGKMTTGVAIIFMLTSFSLSYTVSRKGTSLMEGAAKPAAQQTAPIQQTIPVQIPAPPPSSPAPAAPAAQVPAAPQAAK